MWPIDMCSHWHTGAGDKPQWAQTAEGQNSLNRMQRSPSITPSHPLLPRFLLLFLFSRRGLDPDRAHHNRLRRASTVQSAENTSEALVVANYREIVLC